MLYYRKSVRFTALIITGITVAISNNRTENRFYVGVFVMSVVDIRPYADFIQGHCLGAVSFDGVLALSQRQYELPEASVDFSFVCLPEQQAALVQWQQEKGYTRQKVYLWNDDFRQSIQATQQWAEGGAQPFLWQPSLAVAAFVADSSLSEALSQRRGLDIACGSGRDSVYLAMNGWQMTAIDVRQEALDTLAEFARTYQVSMTGVWCDCEREAEPLASWDDASFELVSVSRYLHRPLLPVIKRLIAPKGFVLYHTFMQGCEAYGSPKNPRFLLAEGELAQAFSDFKIHTDQVVQLADGRPMAVFIAQKPA